MKKQTVRKSLDIYRDASAPADERVRDLLARMTLDEKLAQMSQRDARAFMEDGRVVPARVRRLLRRGIGTLQDPRLDALTNARAVNAIQKILVEETRLGIPALVIAECLHGHMSGGATIFPQAIGLGSTWNPGLVRCVAAAAAREARAVGVAQALSPDLDLARDPRWGRVEETYGEDPYLVARLGVAYIRGMQGPGPRIDRQHLICTAKHFAAHGSPEAGINLAPVEGGLRQLHALYLPPFRTAVVEAGVGAIMPAYSEYDGVPAHASKLLLTRILREEWGFRGYVYADYGGVSMLHSLHRTAASPAEAGRQALAAGLDLEAPGDFGFGPALLAEVRRGVVPVELIDRAVSRILRLKVLAGLFENPYADLGRVRTVVGCAAHRRLARAAARESIVLLKNEGGVLPLRRDLASLAVIGPNADAARFGDYSVPKPGAVTPLQGIRAAVSMRTVVRHSPGCELYGASTAGFAAAVEAARQSEAAVIVVGSTSQATGGVGWGDDAGHATCGEGRDRHDLGLEGVQEELIRAVQATGTPIVVVFVGGRPYSTPWIAENVPAVLYAWYPGEEGGRALADILFGRVNPSGRLPLSVPRSVGHVPAFYNHKPSARGFYHQPGTPDNPGRDYVFASPTPLYCFGHGLSYTTFRYSKLRVTPRRIPPDGRVIVSVEVANTGRRRGQEVVQLYLTDCFSSTTTPVRALKGFAKLDLQPRDKRTIRFVLRSLDLELLDEQMNCIVEPGEFEVRVGGLMKRFAVSPVGQPDDERKMSRDRT